MKYIYKNVVNGSMCGPDLNLNLIGILLIVEDASSALMGELGIDGVTTLKVYNAMWVYSKHKIKFFKTLSWNDKYTVESFISNKSLAKFNIDTAIKNENDELVAYSRLELCAISKATNRIQKVTNVGLDDSKPSYPEYIPMEFSKFDEASDTVDQVTVKFTNIDYLHHTNNVEYIRFILNTYSVKELLSKPIRDIEICYINQSFEGEKLLVNKQLNPDNSETFSIHRDSTLIMKAKINRIN